MRPHAMGMNWYNRNAINLLLTPASIKSSMNSS